MVVLSESYKQNLEKHAIELALALALHQKHFGNTWMVLMPSLEVEIVLATDSFSVANSQDPKMH